MSDVRPTWSTAWVTGASSGLGYALAQRLAEQGTRVAVSARSADKLASLAASNANLLPFPLDVRDTAETQRVAEEVIATIGLPDLVILNAGIGIFKNAARFDGDAFRTAVETNVIGIGNALSAIIPPMVERGSGHIALMGSLASFRGFPRAAHYAPTKSAVRSLAECLRFDLEDKGIDVTIINPGYVETPLTERVDTPMPGLMPLEPAVDRILVGLSKRRYEIAFPWYMEMIVKLGMRVTNFTYFTITRWTLGRA
ncbi:MAG: SDR family NAD(P)-dependent oxidoreductase [Hyphomicrobiaceae bacterium]|nr:SDR family NAD(P)-dependent oxidoreductase [Hyphomicrobiaceae bacterium]MCC0007831.1 SDR family NAD(P)-dependent oxidoreductase [Hyphomicrobiaceae bacterium]